MRLEFQDVGKTYRGGHRALDGVSLTIDRGLFGLLGPNGAGKTTLMKIGCTLIEPSEGRVLVDGRPVAEDRNLVRSRLGYLGQDWGAPKISRCWEVLDLALRLRTGMGRAERRVEIDRLFDLVGLFGVSKRKVKTLSGGMLRRLGVAQALAGSPELLVMDEPTVGLDPDERVEFRNLLTELGTERTILLSTHVVADVGTTCEHVAILDGGRIIEQAAPHELVAKAKGRVHEVTADAAAEPRILERATIVSVVPTHEGIVYRIVGEPPPDLPSEEVAPTLEDAYLHLVPEASAELGAAEVAA